MRFVTLLVLTATLGACGTTAKFVYPDDADNLVVLGDRPILQESVAVLPFEELRSSKNSSGTMWMYLIPLMPYGWLTYDRPDAARMFVSIHEFDFDVTEDLAKAAVASIKRSNLFSDCFFTFGGEKHRADFILIGRINSTRYEGALYTYGLSVFGPLLWTFALPVGSSINAMNIEFELRDSTSGNVVWTHSFSGEDKVIHGLYYRFGHDVQNYARLMEQAMNEALRDLQSELAQP